MCGWGKWWVIGLEQVEWVKAERYGDGQQLGCIVTDRSKGVGWGEERRMGRGEEDGEKRGGWGEERRMGRRNASNKECKEVRKKRNECKPDR